MSKQPQTSHRADASEAEKITADAARHGVDRGASDADVSKQPQTSDAADTSADPKTAADAARPGQDDETQVVWSGDTNGNIAAWLIPSQAAVPHNDEQQQQQPQTHQQQQQQQQSNKQQQELLPVWSAERWHESGVNAMHAAWFQSNAGEVCPHALRRTEHQRKDYTFCH